MDSQQKQNKQLLHYGCLVYLTFKDDTGIEYLVTADGYTKNKILLKKHEDILKDSSISTCLFKIYPTFYNTEYAKARKKYDEKRKVKRFTTIELRDSQMEIPKNIKGMEDETTQNYDQYDKYKSSPVVFGQTVQLLHINSNKYLFYDSNHVSEFESNNLKLSLKDEHSDETCYRIMACYTFQQEGSGNIYDQDIVNIISTVDQTKKIGGEPYLHASKPKIFDIHKGSLKGQTKEKREVNISTEKKTPWKINIFAEYLDERDGFLSVQDTIWINYSEQDLNLVAYRDHIKRTKKQKVSKELHYQFEQCQSNANYTKFIGNSNGLFTLESETITDGGLVKWDTPLITNSYRLRHLTTKQYLKVQNIDSNENLTSVSDYKEASLFQFELIYSTLTTYNRDKAQNFLQKDSYFRASTTIDDKKVWLRIAQNTEIGSTVNTINLEKVIFPSFNEIKKEEFVFKLAKANFNEVRMTNFLLACLKTIKGAEQFLAPSFLEDFSDERFPSKYKNFLSHMTRLEKCLIDLQQFCQNKLIAYLYIEQEFGQVNNFIQNVLREQQFIELLVKLLAVSFDNNNVLKQLEQLDKQEHKRKQEEQNKSRKDQVFKEYFQKKKRVCAHIYKLLDCICAKNKVNQQQTSKYIPIFAQQSVWIEEALECIIQIIRDNEDLLLNLHQQVNVDDEEDQRQFIQMPSQLDIPQSEYHAQYNKIVAKIINNNYNIENKWDLLLFYTNLLKDRDQPTSKKRDIIQFLQFASTHRDKGLNVNQERIYKCLFQHSSPDEIYRNEVLIKFESFQNNMKVFVKGEEMIFVEFFGQEKSKKKKNEEEEDDDDEIGKSKQLTGYLKKQKVMTPSQMLSPQLILSLVSEQMEFYISMCNTRNNTWKKFVEVFLPQNVLIFNLEQEKIGYDMKAIICKLLNKVYIDQEPRRELIYPQLCKVAENNEIQDLQLHNEINNLDKIKDTLQKYIQGCSLQIENSMVRWGVKDIEAKKLANLKIIEEESQATYNKLTLEIVKLFKLMVNFGQYRIHFIPDVKNAEKSPNAEYFSILKSLFTILEFEPTYPEARRLLLTYREEKLKKTEDNILDVGGIFTGIQNQFNIMNLLQGDDQPKDKKKKQKTITYDSGPLNMNESFLKQADVLKKILSKFLQESQENDQFIKLEICDILNLYLDQKMDYCLNIFKLKFKQFTTDKEIIQKLENGDFTFKDDQDQIKNIYKDIIKNKIKTIIPSVLKTGTDADKKLEKKKDTNIFDINIDNIISDDTPKDIDIIDISSILGYEIFPTMIFLFCMTQSLAMQTKILNILTRFYNQREEFADLVSQMLLLFDQQSITILQELKKKLRSLAKNIDESESWLQGEFDPQQIEIMRETVNQFKYLNDLLYENSYIEGDRVIVVQRQKVDEFRQSIMRNMKVYDLCIQLIRDQSGSLSKQIESFEAMKLKKELFQECFLFLRNFVISNSVNQVILSEHLSKFANDLQIDLGQVALINEIFRDNKNICLEKPGLLIDSFRKLIKTNGRQARYLEFFTIIQKVKKEYLTSNQKAVLNMLLDPAYKNAIFWMKERVPEGDQKNLLIKHEFDFTPYENDNPNYKDEPYIYQLQLLEILYTCAIGKEGMLQNETRLRQLIPLKYALEIAATRDHMTDQSIVNSKYDLDKIVMLKSPIILFIYFVYVESEKVPEDIFKCITDLGELVDAEKERLNRMRQVPSEEYIQYLFSHFLMMANGLLKLYQKEKIDSSMVHQNQQQVHAEIDDLEERCKELSNALKSNQFLKQIQLTPEQVVQFEFFESGSIIEMENLMQKRKIREEQEKQKQIEEAKIEEEQKKKKNKNYFELPLMTKKPKPENFKQDEAMKKLWNIYADVFLNSTELKEAIVLEQQVFASALGDVEKFYEKDTLIADHINKNEIFKKLIQFLSKGHNQEGCEQTVKQVLRALSNYIIISQDTEEIQKLNDAARQEEAKQQAQEDYQIFLNTNNAMSTVLQILSDYKDPQRSDNLYNPLLQFGIQMLEGGNREVQRSVYNYFINYPTSEVFFLRLHQRFDEETYNIVKEDEDDQPVAYSYKEQADDVESTLRFLQLFAEGHYSELQNYVRFQQMNYHTYDLFTDVVELCSSYMQVKKPKYFKCMLQCFDTTTEFIQGPCFTNQIALFQANFLDMAQNLLGTDERLDEIDRQMSVVDVTVNKRQDFLPRWMYARLKYKCSITLLSILEARKSNEIVFRLAKSLNLDMLRRNMVDIYDMYQAKYKTYDEKIFGHFAFEPGQEHDEEYCSFIIETGFNLFSLYSIFQETRESDDTQNKVGQEGEEDIMEQLKANIIGEIILLVYNIVIGLNDVAKNLAQNMQDALISQRAATYEQKKADIIKRRKEFSKAGLKFFRDYTAHIEVLREDKMLEKVYFYVLPFCISLDKGTKIWFNQTAVRISVKAKVTSLQTLSTEIIEKMKLNSQINNFLNKIAVLALIVSKINLYRDVGFLLSLTINCMIVFVYHKDPYQCDPLLPDYQACLDNYYYEEDRMQTDQQMQSVIKTLGIIVIVLSMLIVCFFLAQTAPLIIKVEWVGFEKDRFNLIKLIRRILLTIFSLLTDFYVLYYLIYGFTAFLGTLYHPFFFAFHLFDVLVRFPVLLNVVKAVWQPRKAILFTLFLFIVLMYVFTLIAYYWLYASYDANFCYSTFECLLTTIDRSFKTDGGLGGFMGRSTDTYPNNTGFFFFRFFYDNVQYILIMIIMLNIVSGIIIDTFGTLREELKKFNHDLINNCFICGYDKETIEKSSKSQLGFNHHIKQEHYMWNYLFYIAYLKEKSQTELTGIESYVQDKIQNEDISWFPTFRALCMNQDSEELEQQIIIEQLESIKNDQEKLKEILENINQQLEKIEQDHMPQ